MSGGFYPGTVNQNLTSLSIKLWDYGNPEHGYLRNFIQVFQFTATGQYLSILLVKFSSILGVLKPVASAALHPAVSNCPPLSLRLQGLGQHSFHVVFECTPREFNRIHEVRVR